MASSAAFLPAAFVTFLVFCRRCIERAKWDFVQMSGGYKADKGFFERASSLSLFRDIIKKLRANFR